MKTAFITGTMNQQWMSPVEQKLKILGYEVITPIPKTVNGQIKKDLLPMRLEELLHVDLVVSFDNPTYSETKELYEVEHALAKLLRIPVWTIQELDKNLADFVVKEIKKAEDMVREDNEKVADQVLVGLYNGIVGKEGDSNEH